MSEVLLGDCVSVMSEMDADSFDAIVTDPPYGLEFMGKEWDRLGDVGQVSHAGPTERDGSTVFGRQRVAYNGSQNRRCRTCGHWAYSGTPCTCETPDFPSVKNAQSGLMQTWHERWAREAYRVAKPGAHLLAFGGTRTVHRLTSALEDAGWEIRDMLIWGYASGFPKSLNVSDRLAEAVPVDARCACAPRSTRTAPGSQDGYRPEHGSGDGQPRPVGDNGLASAPSLAGARGRSRDGQRRDDPVLGLEHSPDPAPSGLPSTVDSPGRSSPLSSGSQASDNGSSGTPSNTSVASQPEIRRTDSRTRHTPDSDGASWSPPNGDTFPYSKCSSCGGWQVVDGFGTALKPAYEPIVLARKPLAGTVAANVQRWGTGAINVDATRIPLADGDVEFMESRMPAWNRKAQWDGPAAINPGPRSETAPAGRWPPNLLLGDAALFDVRNDGVVGSGTVTGPSDGLKLKAGAAKFDGIYNGGERYETGSDQYGGYGDTGGYARFFLVPKASRSDREPVWGEELGNGVWSDGRDTPADYPSQRGKTVRRNTHPTTKPVDLMRHLVRLVTPPGGRILDPFLGSGTTAIAAIMEGFECVGIEREPEYVAIAEARLNGVQTGIGL